MNLCIWMLLQQSLKLLQEAILLPCQELLAVVMACLQKNSPQVWLKPYLITVQLQNRLTVSLLVSLMMLTKHLCRLMTLLIPNPKTLFVPYSSAWVLMVPLVLTKTLLRLSLKTLVNMAKVTSFMTLVNLVL